MDSRETQKGYYLKFRRFFEIILNFVFPKKSGCFFDAVTADVFIAKVARSARPPGENIEALFAYRDPLVRDAIWELKYRKNQIVAAIFGECLYEHLLGLIEEHALFENKKPLVIPIPLSKGRLKDRGFNQCELILSACKTIDANEVFEFRSELFSKTKETESQTKTDSRVARQKNLKGAFKVICPEIFENRLVFVIDDVTTTGATLSEAIKTIRKAAKANVTGVAIAH